MNDLDYVQENYFGQDDKTRLVVLDLEQINLGFISQRNDDGSYETIKDKSFVEEGRLNYIAAITATFFGAQPGGANDGQLELYGDVFSNGQLHQPISRNARSVANHRYALAITKDNKPEVVLGGWKPEYEEKYQFFMGGLGLLTIPDSASPQDYPTENFDLVEGLINGTQQLSSRDPRYLPLVRDQQTACDVDNRRGAAPLGACGIQNSLTARTALVVTKTSELVFVYLEDGLLPEQWENTISRAVSSQGYEVAWTLLPDAGARARLFARDETDDQIEIFRKIALFESTPGIGYAGYTPPIAFIGAFHNPPNS